MPLLLSKMLKYSCLVSTAAAMLASADLNFWRKWVSTNVQRVVRDDLSCSPALAFELSQKPSILPVLLQR